MNIYTLHQEGSFRPPTLDCDDEILPNQSVRQQPNLHVVTEEKKPHGTTSVTSNTSGSGGTSLGEKTTPRHNTRAVVSRIDATGVITNTNTTQIKPKTAPKIETKEMEKPPRHSASPLKKVKRNGLIHIQAKDEFMIFEDNTDLVSHITTPSAVRTSPLETDYLIIDHDEFAEEEDLFSTITVPKALRKKRNKNKKRSKSKNSDTRKTEGKENIEAEDKNKVDDNVSQNPEQRDLKMVPSTSTGGSEKQEQRDEPQELPQSDSVVKRRQNSLELLSSHSSKSSEHSGSSRNPSLRGGKRLQKDTDEAGNSLTIPAKQDENDPTHGDDQEIEVELEVHSSLHQKDKEEEERSEQNSERSTVEQETSKPLASVVTEESTDMPQVTSEPSPAISKPDFNSATQDKALAVEERESDYYHKNESPQVDDVKSRSSSLARKKHLDGGIDKVPEEGVYGLDVTATTTNLDITNIGSITRTNSNESADRARKVPNSSKPRKWTKFLFLPTSHFCNGNKKKRQQMEREQQSSVPDHNALGKKS